jgi:hypothetical protein
VEHTTGSGLEHHFLLELHRLAARRIHRDAVLALVGFKPDVRLPLALEVALLGGDPLFAAEQAVAAEVLVPLLHEAEPRLVPDEPVVHQLLERGVDVALALEQFVPLRHAALFIADHADRAADPVIKETNDLANAT